MSREPQGYDGRQMVIPSRFGRAIDPYICGIGDKITDPVARGKGTPLVCEWDSNFIFSDPPTEEEKTREVTWQFIDYVRVAAGGSQWLNTGCGDYLDMWISAQPTPVTPNAGSGNCNKVEVAPGSGAHIIIPAAGDGAYDVNLSPSLHAESPVPVTNDKYTGWWDWDQPSTGLGTFTPNLTQTGKYDFYDFPIELVYWVRHLAVVGNGNQYIDPNSMDRMIPPQWTWHARAYNADATTPKCISFYLILAREETV